MNILEVIARLKEIVVTEGTDRISVEAGGKFVKDISVNRYHDSGSVEIVAHFNLEDYNGSQGKDPEKA